MSAYGQSKRRGEELVRLFEEKMEIVVLRPGGIYGPRDSDLFPLFEMAGKGWLVAPAGSPPLQPVYVSDVARLTVAAGTGEYAGLGPYPVAEEGEYRWREIREGLASALNRRVRMVWLPKTVFISAGVIAETAGPADPAGPSAGPEKRDRPEPARLDLRHDRDARRPRLAGRG